jgi:hypothetical protein
MFVFIQFIIILYIFYFQLFLACLANLQKARILAEIDINRLFSNMPDILSVNVDFWHRIILPMLESSRMSKKPLNPSHLKMGFCMVCRSVISCGVCIL